MSIEGISTEELEKELTRRKKAQNPCPKPLENPDFTNLKQTVVGAVENAVKEGYFSSDLKVYIYEAAVEAVYGKDYWEWRRAQEW